MFRPGRFTQVAALYAGAAAPAAMTWDPAAVASNVTLSNGNLTITFASANSNTQTHATGGGHSTGKYYYEALLSAIGGTDPISVGVAQATASLSSYCGNTGSAGLFVKSAVPVVNGVTQTALVAAAAGNTLCIATDLDNSRIWFRLNAGNWNNNGSADPATNVGGINISTITGGLILPAASINAGPSNLTANFGTTAYAQTPPSGFGNW